MISRPLLVAVVLAYVGALFLIAQFAERSAKAGRKWVSGPVTYSLGLAVYCTTWTYYGSVGKAAVDGMLWLTIYLGPTLAMMLAPLALKRIVQIKARLKITSIADFISARYAKSQGVAGLVTAMLLVGIVPYIALQLKAVTGTFALMTASGSSPSGIISPIVIVLMFAFTVMFGIRRLDPTERHPGMMVSIAVESVVKLVAFLAAGLVVTWSVFGGFGGFLARLEQPLPRAIHFLGREDGPGLLNWGTYLLLATCAFMFLPRQFHVAVVENSDPKQVDTAAWLSPLYLVLINLFVLPIALGGLVIAGAGAAPDQFVLALPMRDARKALSVFVFLGGFSAAIGMIMVETMTMATMVSNHLFLPVIESSPRLWWLRRHLLASRWVAAGLLIAASYAFELGVGRSAMLVSMGMLSFAAVTQFLPTMVGGLYWREGNKAGALLGLSLGFALWTYTLFIPTFVRSGWLPQSLLTAGPFGISWLRPEALFDLRGLPNLAHGTLWSLLFNTSGYILGSIAFPAKAEERRIAEEFIGGAAVAAVVDESAAEIPLGDKVTALEKLVARYYSASSADEIVRKIVERKGLTGREHISVAELAELHSEVERELSGAIGAAAAHSAMIELRGASSSEESAALASMYARILASMNMAPSELRRRIDYYQERESLLKQQASELRGKMDALDLEVNERRKAEGALQELNDKLEHRVGERTRALREAQNKLVDAAHRAGRAEIATNILHNVGNVLNSVNIALSTITDQLSRSRVPVLAKVGKLLEDKKKLGDVGKFIAEDPKGKQVPELVIALATNLADEQVMLKRELDQLAKNIEHIKVIISVQQSHAKASRIIETIELAELVEDAIRVNLAGLEQGKVELVRNYTKLPPVSLEKHKLLQILVNLTSNAKHAMAAMPPEHPRRLTVTIAPHLKDRVRVSVKDTGVGISAENLKKLFQHGFTTRKDGHGFGLHGSSIAAKQMDGSLTVESEGEGKGATFIIELPLVAQERSGADLDAAAVAALDGQVSLPTGALGEAAEASARGAG